jgi:THO complex subunit 2
LSPDFLKVRLDTALLALSGILAPTTVQAWGKSEPRIKTAMLYKQQKFNLSREETEGYSKLEVELISSMGPPHDSKTARPVEALAIIRARAEATVTNIKALIGFFDLDPTRALDIILDVFQDNILHHHVFFRELLKASPWGDHTVPEVSKQDGATSEERVLLPDGSFKFKPRSSSSVCAQILGFKFAWYSVSGCVRRL